MVFKFTDQATADVYHDYFYKRVMVDIIMARKFPDFQKWEEEYDTQEKQIEVERPQ